MSNKNMNNQKGGDPNKREENNTAVNEKKYYDAEKIQKLPALDDRIDQAETMEMKASEIQTSSDDTSLPVASVEDKAEYEEKIQDAPKQNTASEVEEQASSKSIIVFAAGVIIGALVVSIIL